MAAGAGMEIQLQSLLGIQCRDFTMIAADQTNMHSVFVMKVDANKIFSLSDNVIVGLNGEPSDMTQFSQYILKNLQLYQIRNHYQLGPDAVAHFVRNTFADGIRQAVPYFLNALVGSYEPETGGKLWLMDFWGNSVKIGYAAHGFGGMMTIGILDNCYRPDLSMDQGYDLLKDCVEEIHQRLIVKQPSFQVTLVDRHGVMELPPIIPSTTSENCRFV